MPPPVTFLITQEHCLLFQELLLSLERRALNIISIRRRETLTSLFYAALYKYAYIVVVIVILSYLVLIFLIKHLHHYHNHLIQDHHHHYHHHHHYRHRHHHHHHNFYLRFEHHPINCLSNCLSISITCIIHVRGSVVVPRGCLVHAYTVTHVARV